MTSACGTIHASRSLCTTNVAGFRISRKDVDVALAIAHVAVEHDVFIRSVDIPALREQTHAEQRLRAAESQIYAFTRVPIQQTAQDGAQASGNRLIHIMHGVQTFVLTKLGQNLQHSSSAICTLRTSSPSKRNGSSGSIGTSRSTAADANMKPAAEQNISTAVDRQFQSSTLLSVTVLILWHCNPRSTAAPARMEPAAAHKVWVDVVLKMTSRVQHAAALL